MFNKRVRRIGTIKEMLDEMQRKDKVAKNYKLIFENFIMVVIAIAFTITAVASFSTWQYIRNTDDLFVSIKQEI